MRESSEMNHSFIGGDAVNIGEISHNFWPDGTFKTLNNAFNVIPRSEPLIKQYAKRGPKPMRVNPSRPNDPNPQASADKTRAIVRGGI